jgi:EAL domain-containing protein (putative c-di-GMP-specific phosphodiesterase class I)
VSGSHPQPPGHPPADVAPLAARPRVLVVDDEPIVTKAHARILASAAEVVAVAHDADEALAQLQGGEFDVIVSDIAMPGMSGTDLLRAVRERDLDLPVIFATGAPSIESAEVAVEHGAFRYLQKPVDPDRLRRAVTDAARIRHLARSKSSPLLDRARDELEAAVRNAIATLRMVYQPIVDARLKVATGFESLMRSGEPSLPSPPAVLEAAQKLGALHMVGRRVRALVGEQMSISSSPSTSIFVNLHSADLADPDLFDRDAPLTRHARRVVLEITERASLEGIADLDDRLEKLRGLGFRLAVDDLGAGYAGLSYFAKVRPEIVKIDMSLVRNVDRDPVRQRVVLSLASLATDLGMDVVAEGVETVAEREILIRLGCTYLQGYALAKPGPPFPAVTWAPA